MKACYPHIGLASLCRLFGVTRQAHYQYLWTQMDKATEHDLLLKMVNTLRSDHPRMGGRKLYALLQQPMLAHGIKIGRDGFFDFLSHYGLLIRKRKRRVVTTNSYHWLGKYPNLVNTWVLYKPNQVWVSDITYLAVKAGYVYLSLLTDAYSKKILGYCVGPTLESKYSVRALKMAINTLQSPSPGLIHHSDRGVQYCCADYINLLNKYKIRVSMGQKGDPLENPVAERVNGILKDEYLYELELEDVAHVQEILDNKIRLYNDQRPHLSCDMLTPNQASNTQGVLKRRWKNYYKPVKQYQD